MNNKEFKDIFYSLIESDDVEKLAPGKAEEFREMAENLLAKSTESSTNTEFFNKKEKAPLAIGLKTLTILSKYSKQQWLSIINEYSLDINLNPRDSARDVLSKLLRHLSQNPEAAKTIENNKTKNEKDNESELTKALNILLENQK